MVLSAAMLSVVTRAPQNLSVFEVVKRQEVLVEKTANVLAINKKI